MNVIASRASWMLATAALLSACGGGSNNANPEAQKSAVFNGVSALESSAPYVDEGTSSINSSDAYVLTSDAALKSSPSSTVDLKTIPVTKRATPSEVNTVDLGAVPADELTKRDRNNQRSVDGLAPKAYQTGIGRSISTTSLVKDFQRTLTWSTASNGNLTGTARFTSTDAYGIRLGLLITSLPDNALVRVSGSNADTAFQLAGSSINEAVSANVTADGNTANARTYWLPATTGASTDLEIELPAGSSAYGVAVSVPSLVHLLESAPQALLKAATLKSDCPSSTPDPVCSASLPPAANSVSGLDFVDGGTSYVCTGTLLADKPASRQPYLLTANHCIASQTVASTLYNVWFWRASACNSTTVSPNWKLTGPGATLLWTRTDVTTDTKNPVGTDTTFLKLNASPPTGVMYAGWTNARQSITSAINLTSLHHPGGYLLRQSTGTVSNMGVYTSSGSLISTSDTTQPFYQINWSAGITEGGSSGSGLFLNGTTSNPQIVGQLWGGFSSCSAPTSPDFYGRFDLAYQDGLINWLNPGYRMVFRFFNPNNGAHFFSSTVSERDSVRLNIPALSYEGPAYAVASSGGANLKPVYRFYNLITNAHFYTITESERAAIQANPSVYRDEGIAWYARDRTNPATNSIPVYRFFRKSLGTHFYTISAAERDSIIQNLSNAYNYEGVAYHAWAPN